MVQLFPRRWQHTRVTRWNTLKNGPTGLLKDGNGMWKEGRIWFHRFYPRRQFLNNSDGSSIGRSRSVDQKGIKDSLATADWIWNIFWDSLDAGTRQKCPVSFLSRCPVWCIIMSDHRESWKAQSCPCHYVLIEATGKKSPDWYFSLTKYPRGSNLMEKGFLLAFSFRGHTPSQPRSIDSIGCVSCLVTLSPLSRSREQTGSRAGLLSIGLAPRDSLPPARFLLLKVL